MTGIIIRKTERDLRERAAEQRSGYKQGQNIDGYARGFEEADRLLRDRGRDNPNQKPILVDDQGRAAAELEQRTQKIVRARRERDGKS